MVKCTEHIDTVEIYGVRFARVESASCVCVSPFV